MLYLLLRKTDSHQSTLKIKLKSYNNWIDNFCLASLEYLIRKFFTTESDSVQILFVVVLQVKITAYSTNQMYLLYTVNYVISIISFFFNVYNVQLWHTKTFHSIFVSVAFAIYFIYFPSISLSLSQIFKVMNIWMSFHAPGKNIRELFQILFQTVSLLIQSVWLLTRSILVNIISNPILKTARRNSLHIHKSESKLIPISIDVIKQKKKIISDSFFFVFVTRCMMMTLYWYNTVRCFIFGFRFFFFILFVVFIIADWMLCNR